MCFDDEQFKNNPQDIELYIDFESESRLSEELLESHSIDAQLLDDGRHEIIQLGCSMLKRITVYIWRNKPDRKRLKYLELSLKQYINF